MEETRSFLREALTSTTLDPIIYAIGIALTGITIFVVLCLAGFLMLHVMINFAADLTGHDDAKAREQNNAIFWKIVFHGATLICELQAVNFFAHSIKWLLKARERKEMDVAVAKSKKEDPEA